MLSASDIRLIVVEIKMRKTIIISILFVVYVALHYIEGLPPVFGMPVAQLWKTPILVILLCYFWVTPHRVRLFEICTFLLAFVSFVNIETINNTSFVIASSIKVLTCVLFFHLFSYMLNREMIERIILNLARFVCLASLLSLLGIVTPIGGYESAEQFGVDGLIFYTSLFGSAHAAASYFAIATIVLLFFQYKEKYSSPLWKYFNYGMIAVALVSIFQTYVRTGWIMLIVGAFMIFGAKEIVTNRKVLLASVLSVLGLIWLYLNNEAFMARMTARRVYGKTVADSSVIDTDGSGRMEFWENGYNLWADGNAFEILFGQGYTAVVENNERLMGIRVFSHNQFVDTLSQNGIIGLMLLVAVFVTQYIFIRDRKENEYYRLCLAILAMTLVFSFFQNEMNFDYAVIYAASLALLAQETPTVEALQPNNL